MRQYPDRENTISLLTDWQRHHAAVEAMMDGIKAVIGLDINGPMFATVWGLWDAYTGALAVEVGDHDMWMEWHQQENEFGARSMAAGYDGNRKMIRTLADLFELIAESRTRGVL